MTGELSHRWAKLINTGKPFGILIVALMYQPPPPSAAYMRQ